MGRDAPCNRPVLPGSTPCCPPSLQSPCVATLTVSLRGWWRAKMRWWKPSSEGATQKPPAQSKGHMMTKVPKPQEGTQSLGSCLSPHAQGQCQPSSAQGPCFCFFHMQLTKAKMGSQRHSYTPEGTPPRALQPPPAPQPTHLQKGALPMAAPPQLELIAHYRCASGTVYAPSSRGQTAEPTRAGRLGLCLSDLPSGIGRTSRRC